MHIGSLHPALRATRFIRSRFALPADFALLIVLLTAPPPLGSQTSPAPQPAYATVSSQTVAALDPEELGDLELARKHFQAAIAAFDQVPHKSATVWNKIGIANQQMFMALEARKSYENALKLEPKNPDALNNLGSVYYAMKEYAIAERLYRKALKANPKSAVIYKNLGTDLLAADKFKKGWDCYQTALAMDPEIFERSNQLRIGEPTPVQKRGAMNYYLAKSYARAGMPDRAVDYLRMAIDEGFTDRKKVLADKEFASLHGQIAFERLISEQQQQRQ